MKFICEYVLIICISWGAVFHLYSKLSKYFEKYLGHIILILAKSKLACFNLRQKRNIIFIQSMKKLFKTLITGFFINTSFAQQIDTIFVSSGDVNLHTVLMKANTQEQSPLAIIIAGSGPTDLNGNNPMMKNNSLRFLAEGLFEKGISTVRFDKRGVGKSKVADLKESELRFEDFVNDVNAIVHHYKNAGFDRIFILGHSEGSLIGMLSAAQTNTDDFVSLAGAGKAIDLILQEQLESKLPEQFAKEARTIMDSLKIDKTVEKMSFPLLSVFRPSVQLYMISWMTYDPAAELAKLKMPVLIVQGITDIQVSVENAELLHKANPQSELRIIEGMNHIFKEVGEEQSANLATYSNPDLPLHPELIPVIAEFVLSQN